MMFLNKCVPCAVSEDRNTGKQARLEASKRRSSLMAFGIQNIAPKTDSSSTKMIATIHAITKYVHAAPIPNK